MNASVLGTLGLDDHLVFTDFKHLKINVDLTISYPSGAGGHWLAGQITDYYPSSTDLNRYDSKCLWLDPDDDTLYCRDGVAGTDIDLDRLYEDMLSPSWMEQAQTRVACVHSPPILTYLITDYVTDQLAVIECDRDTAWFVHALGRIKAFLDTTYHEKQWLRRVLPADQDPKNPNPGYVEMVGKLQEKFIPQKLWMTPLTWMWWNHAQSGVGDLHDVDAFLRFSTEQIFNGLVAENNNESHTILLMQQSSYYQAALHCMRELTDCVTVDYGEYFFDGGRSGVKLLDHISDESKKAYSIANIDLIRKLAKVADIDLCYDVQTRCRRFRERVQKS